MVQTIGLIIIISAVFAGFGWLLALAKGKLKSGTAGVTFFVVALFAGLTLFFSERITEITVKDVAVIKTAVTQANIDVKVISDLRKGIEAQQATINLVAKAANEAKELTNELSEKNQVADQKLKSLDDAITKDLDAIKELQASIRFINTVLAAQNDDRKAFDQLYSWAHDDAYPLSKASHGAWVSILDIHASPNYMSGLKVPWTDGVEPDKMSLIDLRSTYNSAISYAKPALIEYVWNRQDLPKRDRMQFLVDVMRDDTSLKAVEQAGRIFQAESKDKKKPIFVSGHLEWWEGHKDSIQ